MILFKMLQEMLELSMSVENHWEQIEVVVK
jgi:hypothetical protein